jgi:hypothetical protein
VCTKCEQIDATIARYMRLRSQISDQQVQDATLLLITRLKDQRSSLKCATPSPEDDSRKFSN